MESDLNNSKKQCQEVKEENGRLTARVQAMTITAQSEQDVLAIEVRWIVCLHYLPIRTSC